MIINLNKSLGTAFKSFASLAGQISSSSVQISSDSEQLAHGSEQQATSYEELSSSIQNIVTNLESANDITQTSVNAVIKASEMMINSQSSIENIEKNSMQISESVTYITDIADQINLLALNAAIEAARAGEHGKGFAVVADEVKKLAERSSVSAKEITSIISTNADQVQNGVRLSQESDKNIKLINENITQMAQMLGSILTSTKEQTAALEENASIVSSSTSSTSKLADSSKLLLNISQEMKQIIENPEQFFIKKGA
jgi:methyl-accepting chemotaxis protein